MVAANSRELHGAGPRRFRDEEDGEPVRTPLPPSLFEFEAGDLSAVQPARGSTS